jgi:hypothetical protein
MKGRKKGSRRAVARGGFNPPPGAQQYSGPLALRNFTRGNDAVPVRLTFVKQVATTAGSPQLNFSNSNNPTQAADWSNWAANYTEYRVLSTLMHYIPGYHNYVNAANTTVPSPLYGAILRDGAASPLTGVGPVWQIEGSKIGTTDSPMLLSVAASSSNEMAYNNVTTVGPTVTCFLASSTGTTSSYYGDVAFELVVQFRNRA